MQTLANLLWAAWGINRPDAERHGGGKGLRTAPSAADWQETDVYVVMQKGSYVYDATTNTLKPVVSGDYRTLTGTQPFVKDAPVTLVFVADKSKMKNARSMAEQTMWADTAFISENVYIFAASEGLATGVRASIDREALGKALKLNADQEITLAQCVGFPK
jgi:SagB-type dehydrogenase family enzyme